MLNLFIKCQYPVRYIQKIQYNKLQTINNRTYKKLRKVKILYSQTKLDQSEY